VRACVRAYESYHQKFVFVHPVVAVRVEHIERYAESTLRLCKTNATYNRGSLATDQTNIVAALYSLVNTDNRNRYSVYDMMPLSRSERKSCDDPFFKPGTRSRTVSKSFSDITCLLSRAVTKTRRDVVIHPPGTRAPSSDFRCTTLGFPGRATVGGEESFPNLPPRRSSPSSQYESIMAFFDYLRRFRAIPTSTQLVKGTKLPLYSDVYILLT